MSMRLSSPFWLAGLSIQLLLSMPAAHAQLLEGQWTNIAPFPEPHEEVLGQAANGKLYVFAGLVSAPVWQPVGMVYEYDPGANKWTKKKPMAMPAHHVSFTELNGKIYVFGGFVGVHSGPAAWIPINNAFEYDPVADSWKELAPMPTRRGAGVAAAVDGKIYVIGGATIAPDAKEQFLNFKTPQNVVGTVEEYDPKTNTWRARASMPTPRNHCAVAAVNGKIYVIGGRIGAAYISLGTDISLVETYDPVRDSWTAVLPARMPTARSALAYGVYNGHILIAGGELQDTNLYETFRAFEAYDPATDTWQILPPLPVPRHGVAGGVIGNKFYAVSGDVQSSGTGIAVSTNAANAFEFKK